MNRKIIYELVVLILVSSVVISATIDTTTIDCKSALQIVTQRRCSTLPIYISYSDNCGWHSIVVDNCVGSSCSFGCFKKKKEAECSAASRLVANCHC